MIIMIVISVLSNCIHVALVLIYRVHVDIASTHIGSCLSLVCHDYDDPPSVIDEGGGRL